MNRALKWTAAIAILLAGSAVMFSRRVAAVEAPDASYVQDFEKWKAEETDDLKKNWLSLVGLFWLKPGANTFGTDAANSIVFPKGPAHAGEFDLAGKEVTLKMQSDAQATIAGKPVTTAKLEPDISKNLTRIEMGTLRFHVIVRGDRIGIRVRDTDSAASHNFKGMIFYPLDLSYRATATWIPSDGKQTVDVPTVLGDTSSTTVPGTVAFKLNGQELHLTALGGDPKIGLSFVFSDLTAKGAATYPGGRFLDTGPVIDGKVVLDFNRAYNPPCAVTPYATCPLAPKENRLAVAVAAGEKFDKAAHDKMMEGHH
jgi:uncharacterized protein